MKNVMNVLSQYPATIRQFQQFYNNKQYEEFLQNQLFPGIDFSEQNIVYDKDKNLIENIQQLGQCSDKKPDSEILISKESIKTLSDQIGSFLAIIDEINRSNALTQQIINLKNVDYVDQDLYNAIKRLADSIQSMKVQSNVFKCQNSINILLEKMQIQQIATVLK